MPLGMEVEFSSRVGTRMMYVPFLYILQWSRLIIDVLERGQDKPLLDFVFAVSHPSHWHAVNMQQHPSHYSLTMRLLGSDAVAWMQEKGLGAGVWFNVGVEVAGKVSLLLLPEFESALLICSLKLCRE